MKASEIPLLTFSSNKSLDKVTSYLLNTGLIFKVARGVYGYTYLGSLLVDKIVKIVKNFYENWNFRYYNLPILQPIEIWKQSDRISTLKSTLMFDSSNSYILSPTAEELVCLVVKNSSFEFTNKNVFKCFQIEKKFRKEIRPCFSLYRSIEFLMSDAYTISANNVFIKDEFKKISKDFYSFIVNLFMNKRKVYLVSASAASMKGKNSLEILMEGSFGSLRLFCITCNSFLSEEKKDCNSCNKNTLIKKKSIEVAHLFELGSFYSKIFFKKNLYMNCYGIGISRLLMLIIDVFLKEKCLILPKKFYFFFLNIIFIFKEDKVLTNKIYLQLSKKIDINKILFDDRTKSFVKKMCDGELLGIPYRLIVEKGVFKFYSLFFEEKKELKKILFSSSYQEIEICILNLIN